MSNQRKKKKQGKSKSLRLAGKTQVRSDKESSSASPPVSGLTASKVQQLKIRPPQLIKAIRLLGESGLRYNTVHFLEDGLLIAIYFNPFSASDRQASSELLASI